MKIIVAKTKFTEINNTVEMSIVLSLGKEKNSRKFLIFETLKQELQWFKKSVSWNNKLLAAK